MAVMTHGIRRAARTSPPILFFPRIMAGIILPVELLGSIDGLLKYCSLQDILTIWAVGWIMYALLGMAIALVIAGSATLLTRLVFRGHPHLKELLIVGGALALVCYTAIDSAQTWIVVTRFFGAPWTHFPWTYYYKIGTALIVTVGSLFLTARHFQQIKAGLRSMSFLGIGAGLLLVPFLGYSVANVTASKQKGGATVAAERRRPNIILISVDSFSANHSSSYGYRTKTTPALDQLAMQSHVFEKFYANSNFTPPTVNSMINGVRPWTHRVLHIGGSSGLDRRISEGGLVARLRRNGYTTYAVASNIWAAPNQNGSAAWFDEVVYGRANTSRVILSRIFAEYPRVMPLLGFNTLISVERLSDKALIMLGVWSLNNQYDPELAFSKARQMLERHDFNSRAFLWIHVLPPHDPYAAPLPFLGTFDARSTNRSRYDSTPPYGYAAGEDAGFPHNYVGRYDEAIAYVDFHIGNFIAWLKARGIFDDAVVIVTADHGESFGHGYGGHTGAALYEDLIHIPLIIKEPRQRSGDRIHALAEQVDLLPTILDLAGIDSAEKLEGETLVPAFGGNSDPGKGVFSMNFERNERFGALRTGTVAMIRGKWKYVMYMGYEGAFPSDRLKDSLFDLSEDPDENTSLVERYSDVSAGMRSSIEQKLSEYGKPVVQ